MRQTTMKFHFFRLQETPSGRSFMTLHGQKAGNTPIIPGLLVLDVKGSTILKKIKKQSRTGETFFTTSLKATKGCYSARNAGSLDKNVELLAPLAREAYEKLYGKPFKSLIK